MHIADLYKIYLQHPSVQTDTRKLKDGDLFFALKGPNFNGNAFAAKALTDGSAYVVIDEPGYALSDQYILVDDVLATLQELANYHRRQLHIPFIAITGSNGKTTTKELVTAVLRQRFVTYATVGNLNNHIGVPLTLLRIGKDAEMAIIEMGANHLKEIASYCEIAMPTHGIITNCGKAHIEGFGSEEGVRKGKGELYDYLKANDGTIFRNVDLPYLKDMANGIDKEITYGSNDATYTGTPLMDGVFINAQMTFDGMQTILKSQLVGDYNFPNIMTAIAIGSHFGVPLDDISDAIAGYSPDNSRSQWLQRGSNKVILDAYNANPTSMRAAISNFAAAALPNKMLWLGAMKEMGAEEYTEHKSLIEFINQYSWAHVILVGKEFAGIESPYMSFNTSAAAAEYIKVHLPSDASILIKGSRGSKMEVLLDVL